MRAVLFAVALAAVVVGCGGDAESAAPPAPAPEAPAPAAPATPPAAERPRAPAIQGTTLEGTPASLAELRGRPVLVNVWSSW